MRMLRYLMDYLDKEYDITQIEDVKPFHIKHFLLLKQEEGKKPQYINDLLKVYKTFFRYLEEEDCSVTIDVRLEGKEKGERVC